MEKQIQEAVALAREITESTYNRKAKGATWERATMLKLATALLALAEQRESGPPTEEESTDDDAG